MEDIDGEPGPFDIVFDLGEGKATKKILFDKPEIIQTNAIKEELSSFADSIVNDSTPIVPLEDGYQALEVAQQIVDELKKSATMAMGQ